MPRSPTEVSRPSGSALTNSSALGVAQRRHHVGFGELGIAEADVDAHAVVQQEELLRHVPDHRPPAPQVEVVERDPVHVGPCRRRVGSAP